MKPILIFCFIITILANSAKGQSHELQIRNVADKNMTYLLCSTDSVYKKSTDEINVNLFLVGNPSGSAHLPESDEISYKYYIAISSVDDAPEQHLYSIGNFLNPKILSFVAIKQNIYKLVIEHFSKGRTTTNTFLIQLKEVKVI